MATELQVGIMATENFEMACLVNGAVEGRELEFVF